MKRIATLFIFMSCLSAAAGDVFNGEKMYMLISPGGYAVDTDMSKSNESAFFLRKPSSKDPGQRFCILDSGRWVVIWNPYTGQAIDMLDPGVHGWPLRSWTHNDCDNQRWILTPEGDGTVTLIHKTCRHAILLEGEDEEGTMLRLGCDGESPVAWKLVPVSGKAPAEVIRGKEDWENETILQRNRLQGHVTMIPYPDVNTLKSDTAFFDRPWEIPDSPCYLSLCGQWRFNWVKEPSLRPRDFYKESYDVSGWKEIPVPSNWESYGFGTAVHSGLLYPFDGKPSKITPVKGLISELEPNATGSYKRTFTVPESWDGQDVYLHFDGVYSAFNVWVNGKFVGYSQGSNNDSEFDVTRQVRAGSNTIAVEVFKWSDGSFIEDQDMFRVGGIHKAVWLYSAPRTSIADFRLSSLFGDTFDEAEFLMEADIRNTTSRSASASLSIELISPSGNTVFLSGPIPVSAEKGGVETVSFRRTVENPSLWSCETPSLYTVILSLKDASGKELQAVSNKFGFRKIEMKDRHVCINGRQIWFKGVNRHEIHPEYGKSIPVEVTEKDILLMKRYNINTVRTSHYPECASAYALFDYYGLYVVDEADLECHANWGLSHLPSWKNAYIDRGVRMVRRDRNHPSVIFWSLGNESGVGCCLEAERDAIKALDLSRPIHYEGDSKVYDIENTPIADFDSDMYPGIADMEAKDRDGSQRPYFLCEYSTGQNIVPYWAAIENSERMIGGCIWEWSDHEMLIHGDHPGRVHLMFDMKEFDGFIHTGLVNSLHEPKPVLDTVKMVYQYIDIAGGNTPGEVILQNGYGFTNLSDFDLSWILKRDGKVLCEGTSACPAAAPGESAAVKLDMDKALPGSTLEICIKLKKRTLWAPSGHIVARKELSFDERHVK